MQKDRDVIEIDVVELLLYMLRRWYTFAAAVLVTTVAGLVISYFFITPQYESTTKIIILNRQSSETLTYSDMQLASQLTKDYEELITSRDVLETVIGACALEDDYEELLDRIKVENVTDTRIISITVEDPSPAKAREIADSIRETAAEHIRRVTDVEAVNVVEEANLAEEPSSPSHLLWAVLSAAAGFLAVFIVHMARFLSDDTLKSAEDVERCLGISTLALIPKIDAAAQTRTAPRKRGSVGRTAASNVGRTAASHADRGTVDNAGGTAASNADRNTTSRGAARKRAGGEAEFNRRISVLQRRY